MYWDRNPYALNPDLYIGASKDIQEVTGFGAMSYKLLGLNCKEVHVASDAKIASGAYNISSLET